MKVTITNYIIEHITKQKVSGISEDEDLLGSGLVDSLGMMKLIAFIEKEYNLSIPSKDMTVENFMTIEQILNYIESIK
ncbi:MAG: hypothetical protein CML04_11605 [Pseudozobellia sp.]|nr:hypothetical protein [Pseudozobellia sp.]MBG50354.1 hypothetical protein [Pseudozobellia sp.]MBG50516.1 hypothetical protein [Pseudozobellia sp.]|tara:strand:- start:710 stop:943 length:234 start_codon:yes stop_codon:yes gene_type:complete